MLEITIDGKREIGRVTPLIFGQNLEHLQNIVYGGIFDEDSRLSDESGFRKDVMNALKRVRPGILRWPGGIFANWYHWEKGIGPKNERPVVYDLAWGAEESNRFGTDEFIKYCRALSAEPYITVNVTSGTPEEAAHWVEYCNRKGNSYYSRLREKNGCREPYNVKYWSIGNETWGDPEYAEKCRQTARLMKKVDPNIKITAVGAYLDGSASEADWILEVLKTAGGFIDYLSVHRYYYVRKELEEKDYYNVLACPIFSERKLHTLFKLIDAAKIFLKQDKIIKISMDEWNFRVHSLCSALATARFFNVLQRLSRWVEIGGFFPAFLITNKGLIVTGGLIRVDKERILLESSYHAFDLYANHTGEIVLDTNVQSETYNAVIELDTLRGERTIQIKEVPYIDSSATLTVDGKTLFIATVNSYKNAGVEAKIHLRNISVKRKGRVFELNGPDAMACNDLENPEKVKITEKKINNAGNNFSFEFPPHSATVIELKVK